MGIPGAGGPPSLLRGGERCSLVGGEWGRVGLNECLLSYWLLGTRSQEQQVPVVPPKAPHPPCLAPPPVTLQRHQIACHSSQAAGGFSSR